METAKPITGVFLAAGLSSRFGGVIKGLTVVGRSGETLLQVAAQQAKDAGVTDWCFIVSDGTKAKIEEVAGSSFLGLPVSYVFQRTPAWRKKPLGTVDAVLAIEGTVKQPFVVLNGDTVYGPEALDLVCGHLRDNYTANTACCPAYQLKNCLPANGSRVNRAKILRDDGQLLQSMVEQYSISVADVGEGKPYTGEELTSLNVFGFRAAHLAYFRTKFNDFLAGLKAEPDEAPTPADSAAGSAAKTGAAPPKDKFTREFILADVVNGFSPDVGVDTVVLGPTTYTPLEITYQDDVPIMVAALREQGL